MLYKGTIASSFSGKLGGLVASNNTYGTYFRRLVKPVNRRTPQQTANRNSLSFVSQSWRGLSGATQALWSSAAVTWPHTSKRGNVVQLTGQALYVLVNLIRQQAGVGVSTIPPTSSDAPDFTLPTIVLAAPGTATLTFGLDTWNAATGCVGISITPPIQPGRNYNQTWMNLGYAAAPGATPVVFPTPIALTAGDVINFRFKVSDDSGRQSDYVYGSAAVP